MKHLLKGIPIISSDYLKKEQIIPIFIFFAIVIFFNFLISKYQFFITEGWFETFAVYLNSNIDIYQDYQFFLPPLVVNFFAVLINNLGLDFLTLRYIFVFLHAVNFFIILLLLKKYTNITCALLGSLFTFFLIISNSTFIAKDYHTIVSLIVALTLLILPDKKEKFSFSLKRSLIIGSLVGLLIITKHNIGIIYGFSLLIYLFLIEIINKDKIIKILSSVFSFIVGLSTVIILSNFYISPTWTSIFSLDTPKGSIFTILFRFILDPFNRTVLIYSFILVAATYLIVLLIKNYENFFYNFTIKYVETFKKFLNLQNNANRNFYYFISLVIFLVIITFYIFKTTVAILYIFAIAWPLIRIIRDRSLRSILACIPLYALAYCGTTTAGFNSVSLEILLAIFFAEVIFFINIFTLYNCKCRKITAFILPAFVLCLTFGISKIIGPSYNWWGYQTNSIAKNITTERFFNTGIFKNIHMDKFTYDILQYSNENSSNMGNLFTTPSIPIFHLINEKKSSYPLLSWYDTTSINTVYNNIKNLRNNLPDTVYLLNIPDFVNAGHYNLSKNFLLPPELIKNEIFRNFMNNKLIIDYAKVNIDYESCNHPEIYRYIEDCNINDEETIILYFHDLNSKDFLNVFDECTKRGLCDLIDKDTSDTINIYEIEIANQFWYKEIIEKGKSFHFNSQLNLYSFYVFKNNSK